MMVSGETSFHNDLEETDYSVTDDGVTVILKGSKRCGIGWRAVSRAIRGAPLGRL